MKNPNEGKYSYHISWYPDIKKRLSKGITINADSQKEAISKWENIAEFQAIRENGGELPEPFEPIYIVNKSL